MDESLAKIRHERSKKDFPGINLEDGEYVEFAFRRAKVCLLLILGGLAVATVIILLGFLLALMGQSMLDEMGRNFMFIILAALVAAVVIVGLVAVKVYRNNWLFITNKHAIQKIMISPVSGSVNMIDLSSIEDASFRQDGILANVFGYGTLRLATVGDETTYTFKYANVSGNELKDIVELVSKAKKEGGIKLR